MLVYYDFHQLLKPDGNLSTYDEIVMTFGLNAKNYGFIKFIKLTVAIPINLIEEKFKSGEQNFLTFKETIFKNSIFKKLMNLALQKFK